VAAGNVGGDGRVEIIVGQAKGGGKLQVYTSTGDTWVLFRKMNPFGGLYKGGVTVAVGDSDKDGQAEVIAGQQTGKTLVRIFRAATGVAVRTINAFAGINRGVTLAAIDTDGDGRAEIIAGLGTGNLNLVRVFASDTGAELAATLALSGQFSGGVRVGAVDRDGDGKGELLIGAGPSVGGPRVKVLDGLSLAELDSFFAYGPTFAGGVFVG
jgi:hypothetical protein